VTEGNHERIAPKQMKVSTVIAKMNKNHEIKYIHAEEFL
jgi:hypothetical protein